MKRYKPIIERRHPAGEGVQRIYRFENNLGASVVQLKMIGGTFGSYTSNQAEWELAVIRFESEDNEDYELTYATPITDDVIGHLTEYEVQDILHKISELTDEH